jgi:ATP-dependent DNA ligase
VKSTEKMAGASQLPAWVDPMLCHHFPETEDVETYKDGHHFEEKHNGIRYVVCVQHRVALECWARPQHDRTFGGMMAPNLKDPGPICSQALLQLPTGVYDGERLIKKMPGAVRGRDRLTDHDSQRVVLFDTMNLLGRSLLGVPWTERRAYLEDAYAHLDATARQRVTLTEILPVKRDLLSKIWKRRGEGVVLKRDAALYRPGKRSWDWLKLKKIQYTICTIIGFEEGENSPYGVVQLETEDGVHTTTKSGCPTDRVPWQSFLGRKVLIEYTTKTDTLHLAHLRWERLMDVDE